jgi:hypothetical protein
VQIVRLLLENPNTDRQIKDKYGHTAEWYAKEYSRESDNPAMINLFTSIPKHIENLGFGLSQSPGI